MFQWLLSWVSLPSANEIYTQSLLVSTAGTEGAYLGLFFSFRGGELRSSSALR